MTLKFFLAQGLSGSLSGLFVASVLLTTGCAYETSRGRTVYQEPPRVVVVEQDDYVYYPQYEVYYSIAVTNTAIAMATPGLGAPLRPEWR